MANGHLKRVFSLRLRSILLPLLAGKKMIEDHAEVGPREGIEEREVREGT